MTNTVHWGANEPHGDKLAKSTKNDNLNIIVKKYNIVQKDRTHLVLMQGISQMWLAAAKIAHGHHLEALLSLLEW